MGRIPVQEAVKRDEPAGEPAAFATAHNRSVADKIGQVREIDAAALRVRLHKQGRNVLPLHKTESRPPAPEVWSNFLNGDALVIGNSRNQFGNDGQDEHALLQSAA